MVVVSVLREAGSALVRAVVGAGVAVVAAYGWSTDVFGVRSAVTEWVTAQFLGAFGL